MFNKFPYTDFHEMNLDFLLEDNVKVHKEYNDIKDIHEDVTTKANLTTINAESASHSAESAENSAENAFASAESVRETRDQIDLLQSRVDNILRDETQTEGNVELLDIRVGYNGTQYDSAGNAVRNQIEGLSNSLNSIKTIYNYFNENVNANNSLWLNVPIIKGHSYTITNNSNGVIDCSTYLKDKSSVVQQLSSISVNSQSTFTALNDAYYLLLYPHSDGTIEVIDNDSLFNVLERDFAQVKDVTTDIKDKIFNKFEINATRNTPYWINLPIIINHKYKITNNTSSNMSCAVYDESKVHLIQSGIDVLSNSILEFTAVDNGYYFLMYPTADGNISVEDISLEIPKIRDNYSKIENIVYSNHDKLLNLYNNVTFTFESPAVKFYNMPIINGHKYKISNLTNNNMDIALCNEDKTVLQNLPSLAPNNTYTFTSSIDAYYILFNIIGVGTVIIDDLSTVIASISTNDSDLIRIGHGTDLPTIKDGFNYALANDKGVIITPGEYNLIDEGISGIGYILPKIVKGYGAILYCNLPSENWSLSPLNCGYLENQLNVEVYGLTVICSNCRYCIHDDVGAMSVGQYYHHIYKDLTLIHNSLPSSILINPNNIGGGFGDFGNILVENCTLKCVGNVNSDFHSSFAEFQSKECEVKFNNCICDKTITATAIGTDTSYINKVIVSNSFLRYSPVQHGDSNIKLIAYNNTIDSSDVTTYTAIAGNSIWANIPLIQGHRYRVTNNTNGHIAMSAYSEDKSTNIEDFPGMEGYKSIIITASHDAYYLLMYPLSDGTIDVEKL